MARKETTRKRQPVKRRLPLKVSAKKPTSTAMKRGKTSAIPKRVVAPKKRTKVIIRKFRIPVGPNTLVLIQFRRTKKISRQSARNTLIKRLKESPALPLIILGILGTLYFGADILKPTPALSVYSPPAPEVQVAPITEMKAAIFPKSEPVSLRIPDIGMDVPLTSVGRQPDNSLEVPKSFDIPGWYRHSPTPGELGPSVIVGHVSSRAKGPAIFWRLRELQPGQIIEILRADTSKVRFQINAVQQFEQNNFPTQQVYGNIDYAGLRLITCGGTQNQITRQYSHNTVVFASLLP